MNIDAHEIKSKREKLGLTQKEFADALGLGRHGDRLLRSWENGEHKVNKLALKAIADFREDPPFALKQNSNYKFTFIDLFAGIGGIRLAFQKNKGMCLFTSEWDKFAQKTYRINFGETPHGDITQVQLADIPKHDILLAGFPCQPFSQAGLKKGFEDTRGTLFFDIQKILVHKRPKAFLLENVKQFKGHNNGKTLKTIHQVLTGNKKISKKEINDLDLSDETKEALTTSLNYHVCYKVLRAADYGVPQNRERIYLVGFDKDQFPKDFDFDKNFTFPLPCKSPTKVGDILDSNKKIDEKYTLSEKLWSGHLRRKKGHEEKGNGFGFSLFDKNSKYTNTISARYYKDGSEVLIDQSDVNKRPRRLTPRECARLQGFPEEFIIPVSDMQAYKQFGNSVAVPVVEKIAEQMILTLKKANLTRQVTTKTSKLDQ